MNYNKTFSNLFLEDTIIPTEGEPSYYGWWWSTNEKFKHLKIIRKMNHFGIASKFIRFYNYKNKDIIYNDDGIYATMFDAGFIRITLKSNELVKIEINMEGHAESYKKIINDIEDTFEYAIEKYSKVEMFLEIVNQYEKTLELTQKSKNIRASVNRLIASASPIKTTKTEPNYDDNY
jgi:hypothetical protein